MIAMITKEISLKVKWMDQADSFVVHDIEANNDEDLTAITER